MRMYFQTESVARRFANRSEVASGKQCYTIPCRNGWMVRVSNVPTLYYHPRHRSGWLPVLL